MSGSISAVLKNLVERLKPNLLISRPLDAVELQCFANAEALLNSLAEGANDEIGEIEEFIQKN